MLPITSISCPPSAGGGGSDDPNPTFTSVTTPTISSANQLTLSANGVETRFGYLGRAAQFFGFTVVEGGNLGVASDILTTGALRFGTNAINGGVDASLSRTGPNALAVGDGTPGDASGTLVCRGWSFPNGAGGVEGQNGLNQTRFTCYTTGLFFSANSYNFAGGDVTLAGQLSAGGPIKPGAYTIATLPAPNAVPAGSIVYVADGPPEYGRTAVSNGNNWWYTNGSFLA